MDVPEVTFEVDRFEWSAPDTLEVSGRWFGLRGHRFLRPTLDVQASGQRRRMLAVLEHKPWAAEEGEEWIAAFLWTGPPARLEDAELTVSPDLAVQLPLPEGPEDEAGEDAAPAGERRPARRPRTAVLEAELAAALGEVDKRDEELARVRESHSASARELRERARTAQESARRLESELQRVRDQLAAAEAQAETKLGDLRRERDAAVTARDRAASEAADARAERDAAVKRVKAVEIERDALTESRDRARQERNAWMSRARAATAQSRGGAIAGRVPAPPREERPPPPEAGVHASEPAAPAEAVAPVTGHAASAEQADPEPRHAADPEPIAPDETAPPPPSERRTIQIGQRPGPLPRAPIATEAPRSRGLWTPRLIAVVALFALVVVVVLLVLLAF
jgi:TolA-binding protein